MLQGTSRSERGVFWALIALTLLGRLSVALADYKSLIANDVYQDDAFYYLQIARNVVTGAGLSFDGMNPTNGFQPLYFILLLPVMWLAGDNPVAPIHLSGIMLTAFSIGTAVLVFALTRRLSSVRTGLVALGMWALSPYFVVFSINGLETGPAMFFVLACVLAYLVWFPKGWNFSISSITRTSPFRTVLLALRSSVGFLVPAKPAEKYSSA